MESCHPIKRLKDKEKKKKKKKKKEEEEEDKRPNFGLKRGLYF
jgi:hypothetical protein